MLTNFNDTNKSAHYLGCANQTLKQSRNTGKLFGLPAPKYIKLGRSVRYRKDTLQAWSDQFVEYGNTGEHEL